MKSTHKVISNCKIFPLLAQSIKDESVILFSNSTTGTVINEGLGCNGPIGTHEAGWESVHNKKVWRILELDEQIILEQS